MSKNNGFDRCHPEKLCKQIDRALDEKNIAHEWRQNGTSHRICKTERGIIPIPVGHGELPKGTFNSICRALARILATVIILALGIALVAVL